jgi:hypothetical protein
MKVCNVAIGERFGRWVVLDNTLQGAPGKRRFVMCKCDCGTEKLADVYCMKYGKSVSCGCLLRESYQACCTVRLTPGTRFVRLTILEDSADGGINRVVRCRCDCGNVIVVLIRGIVRGNTKSCGCLRRETMGKNGLKHGGSHLPEYRIWKGIIGRCRMGYRGVAVCERWRRFENFLADMGPRPSPQHSIDRFPDKNGNYELANCRWATPMEQARNTTRNRMITHDGRSLCLAEWAEITGISAKVLLARFKYGWSIERALSTSTRHSALTLQGMSVGSTL